MKKKLSSILLAKCPIDCKIRKDSNSPRHAFTIATSATQNLDRGPRACVHLTHLRDLDY